MWQGKHTAERGNSICKDPMAGRGMMSLRNREVVRGMEVSSQGLMGGALKERGGQTSKKS